MQPALLIRLRPAGPWRFGPGDGALDRLDTLYRSDRLFSAVTLAFQRLGILDEWLEATARAAKPAVTFSSLFPFQGDTLFAIPPATLWPPPLSQVTAPNSVFLAKIRWKAAHFVPLGVIDALASGETILADQWSPDPESGCLLRRDRPNASPFRTVLRHQAPVDRLSGTASFATAAACLEFEPGAGLWTVSRFASKDAEATWNERLQSAFRLLADSGFGGRRTSGWGHAEAPAFERGIWPNLLFPKLARVRPNRTSLPASELASRFWLLSLYSPAADDTVDWNSGNYEVAVRSGRLESRSADHASKKSARMVTEGSVLVAQAEPAGAAVDVAPDNFAHPVYRSGLALALELPLVAAQAIDEIHSGSHAVEEPGTDNADVLELQNIAAHAAEELRAELSAAAEVQPEERVTDVEPVTDLPTRPEYDVQSEPETRSEPEAPSEAEPAAESPSEAPPKEESAIEPPADPESESQPVPEAQSEPPLETPEPERPPADEKPEEPDHEI